MTALAIAALLALAAPAAAQAVANPTALKFVASSDHSATAPVSGEALVATYRAKYWPASACVLGAAKDQCPTTGEAFTLQLGKPAPVAGEITVTNVFGGIVLNTVYRAVVEAVGPGGATRSPSASNPFGLETINPPGAPGTPAASRPGS